MAYAALASIMHITEQILNPPAPYPVPFIEEQIKSLQETARFLLDFLERSSSYNSTKEVEILEMKIRDAAYKAEDALESRDSTMQPQPLKKVIEEMNSIKQEAKKIQDGGGPLEPMISTFVGPSKPASRGNNLMVGIDDDMMNQIKGQLIGQGSTFEVVPIVGMGGIGKTTLARTIFNDKLIVEKFDIRAWVTISQEYRLKDVVQNLLNEIKVYSNTKSGVGIDLSKETLRAKKLRLSQSLRGFTYLIVVDDVWNEKAWDDVKPLFPDDENTKCRIILTTRIKKVAEYAKTSNPYHEMKFLNEDKSWFLFCITLFGDANCPLNLEKIGKEIVKKCRGLPLAIVVIAGLLSKQNMNSRYWEDIADKTTSFLTKDDKECSDILSLSYNHLPHNLKPCFLYMGVFPEDYEIHVSKLIKLWIAEGFLRPVEHLEMVAKEYLEDLINRNLILVRRVGSNGNPKTCSIHDLLREICLREAQKEKFLYALNRYVPLVHKEAINARRLSIHPSVIYDDEYSSSDKHTKKNGIKVLYELMNSMSITRSFITHASFPSESKFPFGSKLIRVLEFEKESSKFPEEILDLVNLKYLELDHLKRIPPSISNLRNLQTLVASDSAGKDLPSEIWDMTQLRHLKVGNCYLRDNNGNEDRVLDNLKTLSGVMNFKCKSKLIARISNLRKLKTIYDSKNPKWSDYRFENLDKLCKLESLSLHFDRVPNEALLQKLSFPSCLKKLTLSGCIIPWEDMTFVGKLPNLEVLKLKSRAFGGSVWKPKEGEFSKLRFLSMKKPVGLLEWRIKEGHFECLKHLILRECNLENMSSIIEKILSLDIVELYKCTPATVDSCNGVRGDVELIIHPSKDRGGNKPSSSRSS